MKLAIGVAIYFAATCLYFVLMAKTKPDKISWRDGWPFASVVAFSWPACLVVTILSEAGFDRPFKAYNDAASAVALFIRRLYA